MEIVDDTLQRVYHAPIVIYVGPFHLDIRSIKFVVNSYYAKDVDE